MSVGNVIDFNKDVPSLPTTGKPGAGEIEIDVGDVAKKTLASFALAITNSVLTITVGAMKLTGITVISSFALGWLTKPLHAANVSLAKHAFTPLRNWTDALAEENKLILETNKVFGVAKQKLFFYPQNYKTRALDSFKMVVAPISLALSVSNAALWISLKPLYALFLAPGWTADAILLAPFGLNKLIGHLTYSPLKGISDKMFAAQAKFVESMIKSDVKR